MTRHAPPAPAPPIAAGPRRVPARSSRPGTWPARALRAVLRVVLLFPILRLCAGRVSTRGTEGLPDGAFVLVANHSSHADTAAVLRALPPRLRGRLAPAAAADYFFAGRVRAVLATALIGAFPFPRSGRAGVEQAAGELDAGRIVLLFPEGTRDGGPFRAGVGHLAVRGATMVPVGLVGTGDVLPKGRRCPRRASVAVAFGSPCRYGPHAEPAAVAAGLEAAVRDLAATADATTAAATTDATTGAATAGPADRSCRPARRTLYARARALATSPRGLALVFGWSLAEALVWPVLPDLAIGLLAAAAPRRLVPLALSGAAGSVLGGLAAYGLGAVGLVPVLLLVTPAMSDAAHGLLADAGAAGVWAQPLSVVPYKAFAFAAADHGVALAPFLLVTVLARGARMLAVAAVLGALGGLLRRWCPAARVPALYATAAGTAVVLFTLGLAGAVTRS